MATQPIVLLVAACTLLASAATESAAAVTMGNSTTAGRTAYDMILQKGFPVGILPLGVQHYKLIPNGSFAVELSGDCMFDIAKYSFYYNARVAGRIRYRSMSELDGMMLKVAAAPRRSVRRVNHITDNLRFHLSGGRTTKIAAVEFLVSHRCL